MQTYLGKLDSLIVDYDALMPFTNDANKYAEQRGKFLWFLHWLDFLEFESVRNQIFNIVVPFL